MVVLLRKANFRFFAEELSSREHLELDTHVKLEEIQWLLDTAEIAAHLSSRLVNVLGVLKQRLRTVDIEGNDLLKYYLNAYDLAMLSDDSLVKMITAMGEAGIDGVEEHVKMEVGRSFAAYKVHTARPRLELGCTVPLWV